MKNSELKISDVFDLPLNTAVNELAIIDKNDVVVGFVDAFAGEKARDLFVVTINSHDNLVEQIAKIQAEKAELVEFIRDIISMQNEGDNRGIEKALIYDLPDCVKKDQTNEKE